MISTLMIGTLCGMCAGFIAGLVLAVITRDGIWPDVWAIFMIGGGGIGLTISAFALMI